MKISFGVPQIYKLYFQNLITVLKKQPIIFIIFTSFFDSLNILFYDKNEVVYC